MMSNGGIGKSIFLLRPRDSLYRFIYILCINLNILSNFRSKIFNVRYNSYYTTNLMNKIKKILITEWLLRFSLGGVYLYTSIDIFLHPKGWYWVVRGLPQIIESAINYIGIDNYLKIQAFGELAIALALLAWFLPKRVAGIAGFLVSLQMFLILVFVGLSLETFRDIGLLGGGLALFVLSFNNEF